MYHILEFSVGQPIILWESGSNLHKYTISSGRIYNRGILAKDINKDFHVWSADNNYVSYCSVDGSTVICSIDYNEFTEKYSTADSCVLTTWQGKLLMFYLTANGLHHDLYYLDSSDFNQGHLIQHNVEYSEKLYIFKTSDNIILTINNVQFILSSELEVQNKVSLLPKEQPTNNKPQHSNEQSANMASQRSNEQPSQRIYSMQSNKINQLSFENSKLSKELSGLKNIEHENSTLKYELNQLKLKRDQLLKENERLSELTGNLQEKLRVSSITK